MKNSILFAALILVALGGYSYAATTSITPYLVISNATVSHATGTINTTYNISFMYTSLYTSVQSFMMTFPQGTRFNGTTIPANNSQAVTNMTNGGATVNGTFNYSVMLPANTTSPQTNNTIYINLGNGGINLNVSNGTNENMAATYWFSFVFTNIGNTPSANGSTVYSGFTLQEVTAYTTNGTAVAGGSGNSTTFTLVPQNATNFTVSYGNGQSVVANTTPTYNLTVLVTDQFGNPYSGQVMNFSSRNTSSATANLTVSRNGSTPMTAEAGFWYQNVLNTTNSTGQAGVNAHLGQTTNNNTNEVYQVQVRNSSAGQAVSSFANGSMFLVFNVTPVAGAIDYYILTPSASPAYYDTAFNILVHSYDTIGTVDNINTSSAWSGTLVANANFNTSNLYTSSDGSSYSAYTAALTKSLTSGNVTTYFKYQNTGPMEFVFSDSNSATGRVNVTVTGQSSGGGGSGGSSGGSSTPTPTPSAQPTSTASPTPTPKPSVIKDVNIDSSTTVHGEFGDTTKFEVTYTADKAFYGDLSWRFPLDFADYEAGVITITPKPVRVISGSVLATWENVDLQVGEKFTVTVISSESIDSSTTQQFSKPTLTTKTRPAATPVPTVAATAAPTTKTIAQAPKADYTLWIILLVLIIAGGAYYFTRPAKRKGL